MRYFHLSAAMSLIVGTVRVGCSQPDETVSEPTVTDPVEATAVSFANTKCPIMGGKPSAELIAEYQGKTIGFCCEGCPEKWAALSADEQEEKFAKVDAHAGHDHTDGADHEHSDHVDDSKE